MTADKKHVLIVYYSFTQQTHKLVERFRDGLAYMGIQVELCCLRPAVPIACPVTSNISLIKRMWDPFLRKRVTINPPLIKSDSYNHIVICGPTWSYQPSGPVLDFLDRYGKTYLENTNVSFLISCRASWRTHFFCIRKICRKLGANVNSQPTVFQHQVSEPWRTIGLLFWVRGYRQNELPAWLSKRYSHYGHTEKQLVEAYHKGVILAEQLLLN